MLFTLEFLLPVDKAKELTDPSSLLKELCPEIQQAMIEALDRHKREMEVVEFQGSTTLTGERLTFPRS